MEDISPTLILLWDVKRALEKGQAVGVGIKMFLNRNLKTDFFFQVDQWWLSQTNAVCEFDKKNLSLTRCHLLEIIEFGLQGQAIHEILKVYELELIQSCEDEIHSHLARLPLLLMFPLMGLIFPSLMLLLIGPLLKVFEL